MKKIIYPIISISFFFVFALIFIFSIIFLINSFNKVFNIPEEKIEKEIIKFNFENFKIFAPHLKIPTE